MSKCPEIGGNWMIGAAIEQSTEGTSENFLWSSIQSVGEEGIWVVFKKNLKRIP